MSLARWPALAVCMGSMAAVLIFWAALPPGFRFNESTDYRDHYEPVARSILAGRGIVTPEGTPATRTPPGFPVILAGIFGLSDALTLPSEPVLSASMLLFTGLAAVFVFLIARSIWGPPAGMLAAGLWTTYPFILWLTKQPNSELPFMVVFYASVWLFWSETRRSVMRPVIYLLCGLLLGMAMLIRPIAIGLGVVLSIILWFIRSEIPRRVRLTLIALVLVGNAAAILPWESWVYARTGRIIALSTIGAESFVGGLTFAISPRPYPHVVEVSPDVRALMFDIRDRAGPSPTLQDVTAVLVDEMRVRPATVAKLFLLKAARSWYGTDSERFETLILRLQVPYIALIVWSNAVAWRSGGVRRHLMLSLWMIVLYFWAIALLSVSLLRYMVPAVALLFVTSPAILPGTLAHTRSTRPQMGVAAAIDEEFTGAGI